jgi:hypothetical protein
MLVALRDNVGTLAGHWRDTVIESNGDQPTVFPQTLSLLFTRRPKGGGLALLSPTVAMNLMISKQMLEWTDAGVVVLQLPHNCSVNIDMLHKVRAGFH